MELIESLEKATAADLADLDQKIAAATTSLEMMQTLRKVLDVKINGPRQRKKRASPARVQESEINDEPAVITIMKYLEHAGTASQKVVADALGMSEKSLLEIVSHHAPCFEIKESANRWGPYKRLSLSLAGKKSLEEDRQMANAR